MIPHAPTYPPAVMDPPPVSARPAAPVLLRQWVWKTPAMRQMTLDVARLALERGAERPFSALDLPRHGEDAHGGSGIAGSVFRQLADAEVIQPVGGWLEDGTFVQRRVRNANGNPVGVWRLRHAYLAAALLRQHGQTWRGEPRQLELAGVGSTWPR